MKKIVSIIVLFCAYFSGFSQEISNLSSETFLKSAAEKACKCVDSIATYNRSKQEVVKDINSCIDKQVVSYQLVSKLVNVKDLKGNNTKVAVEKNNNIAIDQDKNSEEYKKYYYDLERFMMANCVSLKTKIASDEKQATKSYSDDPKAKDFYSKGLEEFEKEKYEKAIDLFNKALKEDPNFAFAWDNIGLSYRKLGKYDKALEAYNKSLELDPNGAMPLQNIAIVYQYQKEYQKAIDAYERLAKIDKDNPEIYFGIGNVYTMNLMDYEKGLDNMCKAYNLYVAQKSAYRTDAEKIIGHIYSEMKKQGKEAKFNEILKANAISQ